MELPEAWQTLLGLLDGTHEPQIDSLADQSRRDLRGLLALASVPDAQWERDIALAALSRAFLSVLPAVVIENPEEPCRHLVEGRLAHLLGSPAPDAITSRVMRVVKQIQIYHKDGRSHAGIASLDMESSLHLSLLRDQGHRCAACGYFFTEADLESDAEMPSVEDSPVSKKDRSPAQLKRRAALDHKYPVYLAGDRPGNWQILCFTCNSGKSDMLFGFESRQWFSGGRISDLLAVTAQLFYMVVKRDGHCVRCNRRPLQTELRLARKDEVAGDLYTNLIACCRDCLLRA